jgi:hypothetical protein
MNTLKERLLHIFIISIFCGLYFLVATISMINSVAFFDLSHSGLMSWSLAIGFEIGAAASLAAIVILEKTNKSMVWGLFLLLTSFQMMANSFHAFVNLEDYMGWVELFGLEEAEPLFQKRILSIVSGAILPLVALGFIKSLVDYVRPSIIEDDFSDLNVTLNDGLDDSEYLHTLVENDELLKKEPNTHEPPIIVGEAHVGPDTVAHTTSEPIINSNITPVGDPIIIPTNPIKKNNPLVSRHFVSGASVQSKP